MATKRFLTNCVNSDDGEAIEEMVDNSTDITRRTLTRHIAWSDLLEIEKDLGYEDHPKRGLTMAGDWHVKYAKSTYQGQPCVYFTWSAIEYIFV